jgi:two-component system cell cycle response regulator CtrA
MTLRDDLVMTLEAENEMLRERLRQLEHLIGVKHDSPPVFGLTRSESAILGLLLKNKLVRRETAMLALYNGLRQDEAEVKIIDVFVCKMRRKLTPFAIEIRNKWGEGYYLDADAKAKVSAMLDEAQAA